MKIYFKKEYLFFTILALLFFPFSGLAIVFYSVNYIRAIGLIIVFIILLYCSVRQFNIRNIHMFYCIVLYYGYLTINTLVNKGDFVQLATIFFNDVGIFILIVYAVNRNKYHDMIVTFDVIFNIEILVNLIHMLTTDIGFGLSRAGNKIFILTSDNGLLFYVIIFTVVHELRNEIKSYGRIRDVFFYGTIFIELIIGESATSLLTFTVILVCVLIYRKVFLNKCLILGGAFILFLNFFLIFIRKLQFMQNIFQMLGKNINLSGRDVIWNYALSLISQSPVFGYGVIDNMYYVVLPNWICEAHNMLLSCMLQGGVILLVLYFFMIIQSCYKIKHVKSVQASCLAMGLVCYWVGFLVESPSSCSGFFMLIALCQFGGTIHAE